MSPTLEDLLRRIAELEGRAEKDKQQMQTLQQRTEPSLFLDYLRSTEENLFATFRPPVPSTTTTKTSSQTTCVNGKFYPRRLRPWTEFEDAHTAQFRTLTDALEDHAVFPALTDVLGASRDLSPTPNGEMDLRPFVRASIEKPAVRIINAYMSLADNPPFTSINFQNNSYGLNLADTPDDELQEVQGPAAKRQRSPVKRIGIPDRWCVGVLQDGSCAHVLVGEYKAAHKLPARKLKAVLSTAPGEDFFRAKSDATGSQRKAVPGDAFVARVLCQAYHYMITSGLEFGYVASGDGLVFLRVLNDDPQTLYYSCFVFPIPLPPSNGPESDRGHQNTININRREPRKTAAAYLASLCMLALQSSPRPKSWIDARDHDLARWPDPYGGIVPLSEMSLPPPPPPPDAGTDGGSAGGSGNSSGNASNSGLNTASLPKRRRSDSNHTQNTSQHGYTARTHFVVEPPTLPYCTQACLRGLCNGAPLDDRCPNVALHRAAWLSSPKRRCRHLLTASDLRSRVVAQLADNMDKDCECLDRWGCFGRYGVLFKIVVTGYGYTLVAKGVQAVHRHIVQHEAAVYAALAERTGPQLQGRLIPVFLGIVGLERPLPLHSCARVPYLMLMSYAGPTLASHKTRQALLDAGTDWEAEQDRTLLELEAAGLYDEDARPANLAWNAEAGRVMRLDFGQAYVESLPVQTSSPVLAKRDLDAHCGAGDHHQPALKRMRTGSATVADPMHD
ncbi:metalloprotease m41 [Grosmannia clavigera kw1407]|uniref:Metalloprotease m41 n=1 Tax=Grosmannia clavigera (strain kw1407 / UAMH 11150) TaxID=655863 RepID=F0XQE1_GROCL|nr:metalloprotease m41 [Grosmannia clavigera kw1407]EFX00525.1 metalloprotease m41 [Grosmannia clavigera kw1407]